MLLLQTFKTFLEDEKHYSRERKLKRADNSSRKERTGREWCQRHIPMRREDQMLEKDVSRDTDEKCISESFYIIIYRM